MKSKTIKIIAIVFSVLIGVVGLHTISDVVKYCYDGYFDFIDLSYFMASSFYVFLIAFIPAILCIITLFSLITVLKNQEKIMDKLNIDNMSNEDDDILPDDTKNQ